MAKVLSLARVFERVGYDQHPGQQAITLAKAHARFRVVCAGRRTGKSTQGGHELTGHAFEAYFMQNELDPYINRREYWIVGPEYSDAEKEFRVLYADLDRLGFEFDRPGTYYDAVGGNMHISLFGGRFQVHAKSAKYPGTLVGEGLNGVILAEAAKLKPAVWPKFIRPMLVDSRGWALFSSTPEGKNWFYQEWLKARTSQEYWSIRMPSWVNTHLFPLGKEDPEVASLAESLNAGGDSNDPTFQQEIGAEFTDFVGKVFKNYDEEVHLRPLEFNRNYQTFAAVDYGWTNPFVWLLIQVTPWDDVHVIGEYYHSHKLIDDIPGELKALGLVPDNLIRFYPDPAAPGDTAVLERELKVKAGGGTGGELNERLRLIRKWMDIPKHLEHLAYDHPERKPKLLIDPAKCPKTAFEMGEYRYPQNKNERDANDPEKPLKKDDHTPEALGRFFMGYYGPGPNPRGQGGTRVRKGQMVSR